MPTDTGTDAQIETDALEQALRLDPFIIEEYNRFTDLTAQMKRMDSDLRLAMDTDPDVRSAEDWDNIRGLETLTADREDSERTLRLLLLQRYYLIAWNGSKHDHSLVTIRYMVDAVMRGKVTDDLDVAVMAAENRLAFITTHGRVSIGYHFSQPMNTMETQRGQNPALPFVLLNTKKQVATNDLSFSDSDSEASG